jgi:hypothetical protein
MAAARQAVRRYHDGFSPLRRLRSVAAEALMAAPPVAQRTLSGARVITESEPDADRGVLGWLRQLLDEPNLLVAVSLSVPKSNRKPVLQLLDPAGHSLGWAKIGWNQWTEDLIVNEARWLRAGPHPPPNDPTSNDPALHHLAPGSGPLIRPEVLHDAELCGHRVVVTSGVRAARFPHRRATTPPAAPLFRAVADLDRWTPTPIDRSPWWASVEAVLDAATSRELAVVEAVRHRCGNQRFDLGAWHGDLTPWNLMTTRHGVQVIDWEFAAPGTPFGFDLCHFHTQVAMEIEGHDSDGALAVSARRSIPGMADLGVTTANLSSVWLLYLVELIRRTLALRAAGHPIDRVTHGRAALARLEATLADSAPAGPEPSATDR